MAAKPQKTAVEQAASAYIPTDWRQAIAQGTTLDEWTSGTALFADISGFTPLTEALTRSLGLREGAERLTLYLNQVYDALIAQVDLQHGSVISFAGDAITCWFTDLPAEDATPAPLRATACALAMQQAMQQFERLPISDQETVALAVKIAAASGKARRLVVGDPSIQQIAALAGETLARMAAGEHLAARGEVLVDQQTASLLGDLAQIDEWRSDEETADRFAVVSDLQSEFPPTPWPAMEAGALTEEQVRPWVLDPIYQRLRTGLGEFLTELRPAAVLFLSFLGIDYDKDADAGEKLNSYIRWVQGVLTLYKGTLLQLNIGDKGSYFYASFGAPIAHENDDQRALAAALELHSPPPELGFIEPVKIGVNQGVMRVGAYGGTTRRTYGVMGDEVNLAARFMQHACPGETLVGQRIQKANANTFVWEPLEPIRVKGKTEPVVVAKLLSLRQTKAAGADLLRYTTPLVGRHAEQAHILEVLDHALLGNGQILRLEGPTGVGKSHLIAEFVRQAAAQGAQVYVGACQSTTQHMAYSPWQPVFMALLDLETASEPEDGSATDELVAQLEATLEGLNPEWRVRLPLLGDLLDLPLPENATTAALDPRLRQQALFTLAIELIQASAEKQPLALVIEDAHWMDEASRELATALARVIPHSPLLFLLTQRPPIDEPTLPELDSLPGYSQLELGSLAGDGISALVANLLETPIAQVSPLAISLIQAQAQGNPFFAEEIVSALRETDKLVSRNGSWILSDDLMASLRDANCLERDPATDEWRLCEDPQLAAVSMGFPDSVHGTVLSRLDRLPEEHKLTLKVASVIGRNFELQVLAQAHPAQADPASLLSQLHALTERDFVQQIQAVEPVYMFRHNVSQEVVYETLPGAQQRDLHYAVGAALETSLAQVGAHHEPVERLAYHFCRGGAPARDKAMLYLDKAAHKAQREFANQTALNYYAQALDLEERWEWREGQVLVLHILGRRQEQEAALRALETAPQAPTRRTAYLWGEYYEAVSDYAKAQAAIERALTAGDEQVDRAGQARGLGHLGLIARRQGDYEGAKGWYQKALALFEADTPSTPEEAAAQAQALNGLGIVHRQQGEFDAARACYQQALTLSQERDDRRGVAEGLNSLGSVAHYQRDLDQAVSYYRQAIAIRRSIGDRTGEATTLYNLAYGIKELGEYSEAEQYLNSALAIHQATGNKWEEVNVWNVLGILFQELGSLARASECLSRALDLSQEIGDEAGQAYVLANVGLVERDQGNLEHAQQQLAAGLALAEAQDDTYLIAIFAGYLSTVSLEAGDYETAIEQANSALELHQETGQDLYTADDLATIASAHLALGRNEQALDFATQALAVLNGCGGEGPEFAPRDYYICHQVFTALGQGEKAQAALQAAQRLVTERADKITDAALRQSFLEGVPINRLILEETLAE
jgi:predicted ATPase/class 3 adenylate cyclase